MFEPGRIYNRRKEIHSLHQVLAGARYPNHSKRERYESLLQSKRDANAAVRQSSKVEKLNKFLEAGLQRPIESGTLQTVRANTKEGKTVKRGDSTVLRSCKHAHFGHTLTVIFLKM